uniref:Uncharacterized protein n=1 Tax=Aegilops tauschii subsp. strangulata TaxID=200361 RepID=A0A452XAX9_AEGTS
TYSHFNYEQLLPYNIFHRNCSWLYIIHGLQVIGLHNMHGS